MMTPSTFIYRYRWPIVAAAWIISLAFALAIPRISIDPDVKALIPNSMPTKVHTDSIEKIFGGSDMIILLLEEEDILSSSALERLQKMDEDFRRLPDIERTQSIFNMKSIEGVDGMMLVEPALTEIPVTDEQRELLRKELSDNKMVMNTVISDDFRYGAIIGTIGTGTDNKALLDSVRGIIDRYPGSGKVQVGGFPVVKQSITDNIVKDLRFLLPAAIFLMLLMLTLSFRDYRGVFLPLSVVLLSILVSAGLIPLMGWKFALVTVLLPVMMIAIGNNYGIYLVNRYQEILKREPDISQKALMEALSRALSRPIFLCAITTIAGILALLTHIIVPAREVGVLAAIGIGWALLLSLTYIPAMLGILPRPGKFRIEEKPRITPIEHLLFRTGILITRRPGWVLLVTGLITVMIGWGVIRITVEGNTVNFFRKTDPVRTTSELIDQHFGGSQTISIQFSGDIKEPEILNRMLVYEQKIKEEPGVGQVVSVASVIRLMSKALLNPGEAGYDSIPDSRDGVAQYLELYNLSGDPADFEQLVDFNYENAQVLVRINDPSSKNILGLADRIQDLTRGDETVVRIGGVGLISAEMTHSLVTGQWRSTLLAIVVVCLMVALIFKRLGSAFTVLVPLGMACIVLFGVMGWAGIPFDPATTLITSVMIGCGVDYTVQFLWRLREEKRAGHAPERAVVKTLYTTGKAISFNALAVMVGFLPLIFSTFSPIRFFGIMMLVSIFTCLLGALVVIPALEVLASKYHLLKTSRK